MQLEIGVPVMFTIRQAAQILNVSRTQVYKLIKTNELDSVKVGRSRRVTESQLVAYIQKLEGKAQN
jgi:excisionase family DNA binding protein